MIQLFNIFQEIILEFENLMERGILVNELNKELLKTELFASPFLDLIKRDLIEDDEIILIILAGSRASGLATLSSDIDLAVRTLKS
jgi:predicted nucleotidyltransferase